MTVQDTLQDVRIADFFSYRSWRRLRRRDACGRRWRAVLGVRIRVLLLDAVDYLFFDDQRHFRGL